MNPKTIPINTAISLLKQGGVGVMPTDTVYGIVAVAANSEAVTRLYGLKDRERKPGTIIAATTQQLRSLNVPQEEINKVAKWWPNPLSAVLLMDGNDYLHQGVGDIAMRVVNDELIQSILLQTGPLLTSSANLPGQPNAKSIDEAFDYFKDSVDFYVDGGILNTSLPSTIIKPSVNGDVTVLRQGTIEI